MECKICGKEYKGIRGLSIHIVLIHKITLEDYYLQFVGDVKFCDKCGVKYKFKNLQVGYIDICPFNTVIEHLGTYYHMTPDKYRADDYNKTTHKTASQHWELDRIRRENLRNAGFRTVFIYETDVNNGNYKQIIQKSLFEF